MRPRSLVACLALILVTGCAQISDQMDGAEVDATPEHASAVSVMETVDWAELEQWINEQMAGCEQDR